MQGMYRLFDPASTAVQPGGPKNPLRLTDFAPQHIQGEDRDDARFDPYTTSLLKLAQSPRHGFPRHAGQLSEFLLGKTHVNHRPLFGHASTLRCQVQQCARYFAIDIEKRQAMDELIGLAEALAEHRGHFEQNFWGLLNDVEKMVTGDCEDCTGFLGRHSRRPWLLVQQGHVTEEIRGVQYAQNHFIAVAIFNGDFDQSTLQDIERIAWIINMDNRGVLFIMLFTYYSSNLLELFIIQLGEQWDFLEKINIRHHACISRPLRYTTAFPRHKTHSLGDLHHIGGSVRRQLVYALCGEMLFCG